MTFALTDIPRLLPELLLIVLALLVLGSDILERWGGDERAQLERSRSAGSLAAIGLGLILVIALVQSGYVYRVAPPTNDEGAVSRFLLGIVRNLQAGGPNGPEGRTLPPILGAFATDHLTMVGRLLFITLALLTALLAYDGRVRRNPGEFFCLLLLSTAGMCLMAGATELMTAFLAVELASIPLYVLAGYFTNESRSAEAGMKYFVFGALSSGILLYGMSLTYGLAASGRGTTGGVFTQFNQIATASIVPGQLSLLTVAIIFIVAGLGYKIGVVPFHSWSPDVYQGSPTLVTAFLSTASKTAGFILLLRVLVEAFPNQVGAVAAGADLGGWSALLALMALLTLLFGNLAALPQRNAKRLLAYSSIAQAGFLLLGLVAWSATNPADKDQGVWALLYYLVAYCLSNAGAFGALAAAAEALGGDDLAHLNGLARRNLPMAVLLAVCILSLAGIPPLAGFFGKFYIFMAAWQAGALWVVVVAVASTIVSLYYYLLILKAMFITPPASDTPVRVAPWSQAAVIIAVVLVVALGLFPNIILQIVSKVQLVAAQ